MGAALVCILAVVPAAALAAAAPGPVAGTWRTLPVAPIAAPDARTSTWTGNTMVVFGRAHRTAVRSVNVAAAYDPRARTWRRLAPPLGPSGSYQGRYKAVWTGKEVLVWGPLTAMAFNPGTNRWRQLPLPPTFAHHAGGIVVWTGRELIGWGGGCCGDAFADGAAYRPATNSWRKLARSPLAGGQDPAAAWTGRELIVLNGGDVEGRDRRGAAAYDPATDTWRRVAPLPAPRFGAAVWDGREVLVVGGAAGGQSALPAVGFAYDPAKNRWRTLPRMDSGRTAAAAVWTGKRLLIWGGQTGRAGSLAVTGTGLAFDPRANRWSSLPRAPVAGRLDPVAVWTGHALIVWGGDAGGNRPRADGASFKPTTP